MRHLGYPDKIVRLLQALYNISKSAVRVNNDLLDWFKTFSGVRQGCILSLQLFNILLEQVITMAIQELNIGVTVQGQTINNLRVADDIVLLAESEEDLQLLVSKVQTSSKRVGLTINQSKTEVQLQMITKVNTHISIIIEDMPLKQVPAFTYLGSVITDKSTSSEDIKRRIGLAMGNMRVIQSTHPVNCYVRL